MNQNFLNFVIFIKKKAHKKKMFKKMSNLDIKQRLFSWVGVRLEKEVVIVMPVGGFPVSSTKRFLLDSLVCQGDTDGENVVPIDLTHRIDPKIGDFEERVEVRCDQR